MGNAFILYTVYANFIGWVVGRFGQGLKRAYFDTFFFVFKFGA